MIEVAHPWSFLLLFLGVPLLWLAQRRSLADLTPSARRLCLVVRAIVLGLLVLALAGVNLLLPSQKVAAMFVIDHSASVSSEARAEADQFISESLRAAGENFAGVTGFAKTPALWIPIRPGGARPKQWPAMEAPNSTDIARALDFASALLPAEAHRRIILLSDGNDTSDRAAETAQRLTAEGIELSVVPLHNPKRAEVLVEKVDVPRQLKTGEPFDLTANIRSNIATTAKAKLYQNQFLVEQRDLSLKEGDNTFAAPNLKADGTFVTYELEIIPATDTSLENNRAQGTASLRGQPRVLVIDPDESRIRPLATALRAERILVETRSINGAPRSLEDLQQFDLLALSDVSALQLNRETMELYR
ncbi:MAG TPA: vWA domain-containing protein, partial [Chthoniobacteraceae bacterium]|nr:vWA domain-containing protein [Chthoniobacteraceae bacterium]